ncbi:MAG: hypothetical protein KGM97_08970, partial [Alphaproteobacteria bacterium]|nr:hypothetical protein [Alphaproteobacteria bacterium]
ARQLNLPITSDVLKRIGEKNQCRLVLDADLKPIDFEYNELLISSGSVRGWADPHVYILYVNGSNS